MISTRTDTLFPYATCFRAAQIASDLPALVDAQLGALEREWPHSLPSGVIHADLFPDNALFRDGRISGVIDFYFACTDSFAYDLAVTHSSWCFSADGDRKSTRLTSSH